MVVPANALLQDVVMVVMQISGEEIADALIAHLNVKKNLQLRHQNKKQPCLDIK